MQHHEKGEHQLQPTVANLKRLQESHLKSVPFENLSQHGAAGGLQVVDVETIANKILDRNRGGFCFELNGLFGTLLAELGYSVTYVPAHVWGPEGPTEEEVHIFLIVRCQDDDMLYFVDVGFGEPPLHPLKYDPSFVDMKQTTPDGMVSKIVKGDDGDSVTFLWHVGGEWKERLSWSYKQSMLGDKGPSLADFEKNLAFVQCPESIFSQKIITCLLTDKQKFTLAGSKLKVTGPPRFGEASSVTIEHLESDEDVRRVLHDRFGIPMSETAGLDLSKSLHADPNIWAHQ